MTYTFRQGDLPKLDLQVDRGTDFTAWRTQWESYCSLSGLDEEDPSKQVKALMLCFSRETLAVVQNLGLTDDDMKRTQTIIDAIRRYVDGHINETVERRNFRRRVQQPGEPFNDFLIALRELVKTCKFCSEACAQKSMRDQIIEGLRDGDTVEDLLQESGLTLANTIAKCQSREAAKKHRFNITVPEAETVAALRRPHQVSHQGSTESCPGCGASMHRGGRRQCPAYNQVCLNCHKLGHFARVCRGKQSQPRTSTNTASPRHPSTNTIRVQAQTSQVQGQIQLYNMKDNATESAPTITVSISSSTGTKSVDVLPDSGADISAAGQEFMKHLGQHRDNLVPSAVTPRTVNGSCMKPWGKIPVTIQLGNQIYREDIHIYPGIAGALISWKAAKGLGILPPHYPYPQTNYRDNGGVSQPGVKTTTVGNQVQGTMEGLVQEFPSVFDGQIRSMEGETFHIYLVEEAIPFCVKAPRSVPFAYREKLKAELQLLQEQGIIIPVVEATEWCAPIVVTPKKGTDRIRMCVDLSRLNRYVRRERYQSPTPAEAVADIAAEEAKYFTVLDAMKGYHQCPLDEESQVLTTFITPFGRFKYLRAPYGLSSIAEHYNRRMAEAFEGLSGFRRVVDDIVIFDKDKGSHKEHVRQFIQRCNDRKISINIDKVKYCQSKVTFAGFQLSTNGYQVDSTITEAISRFPTPANRTDLRSFCGLVNQLTSGTNVIAELISPLRPLLSTKNDFVWSHNHAEAFSKIKEHLVTSPVLAFFDLSKPTRICTDASRQGLGFVLQQQSTQGEWTLVQAGSRFLSNAESRYAIIELELLAVTWAILKCKMFLEGLQHFRVITDHNPLIPILNSHRLDEIENPRLQRLRTRLMAFNFTAEWCKGTKNQAPDALSRNPVGEHTPTEALAEQDDDNRPELSISEIRAVWDEGKQESARMQNLRTYAEQDMEYQQLKEVILKGFPDHKKALQDSCKQYWHVRHHLTLDEDLIVNGCRLVIPVGMRREVLNQLHEAHQGVVRTKQRAKLTVYWPGLDNDIDNLVSACNQCQNYLPSNVKEPIILKPKPAYPFQEIAADFCHHAGRNYLIIIDCYSDWPTIIPMGCNTTTSHLITAVRTLFSQTAVPDVFWSDGGPQFTARKFQCFAEKWGFIHRTSTPYYPKSNGKAESAVKSMKKIIRVAWNGTYLSEEKLCKALLQYRNTPSRKDGLSPAQKLYGRPVQDTLPAHHRSFAPEWQRSIEEAEKQAFTTRETTREYYNATASPLPEIQVGSNVAVQNPRTKLWDTYGVVTAIRPHRKYHVKTKNGTMLIRNRHFLRRRVPASIPEGIPVATQPMSSQSAAIPHPAEEPIPQRRSSRIRKPPQRLLEDPTWN